MPNIPAATIKSIGQYQRKRLEKLLFERAVMGYRFSYAKLLKEFGDAEAIGRCLAAMNDDEAKAKLADYNDEIAGILAESGIPRTENGSQSLVHHDPFGNERMFIYMSSTATAFSSKKAVELAASFGMDPAKVQALLDAATTKTPYSTVQCRKAE